MTDGAEPRASGPNVVPAWLKNLWHRSMLVMLVMLVAIGVIAGAVVVALIWPVTDLIAAHDVGLIAGPKRAAALQMAREAARTQLLTLGAGVFAAGALIFTARNFTLSRRTFNLAEQGQVTDRYTKAIDQLGTTDKLDVRIGGIYALERLAFDSPIDHPTVMEVLAAFIREHSGEQWPPPAPGIDTVPMRTTRPDVQAAVTVIGRRNSSHDHNRRMVFRAVRAGHAVNLITGKSVGNMELTFDYNTSVNLADANLTGADLIGANLSGLNLSGANLSGADLTFANLGGAYLDHANLDRANLDRANLDHAYLFNATLDHAYLRQANLDHAYLWDANLADADLGGAQLTDANLLSVCLSHADLTGANLTGANLNDAQLDGADLGYATLVGVYLWNADLTGAILSNSNLTGADLGDDDFFSANISDAGLHNADLSDAKFPTGRPVPEGWIRDRGSGRLKRAADEGSEPPRPEE